MIKLNFSLRFFLSGFCCTSLICFLITDAAYSQNKERKILVSEAMVTVLTKSLSGNGFGNNIFDENAPIVDLSDTEKAKYISWTSYLFKDELNKDHSLKSPGIKQEIISDSFPSDKSWRAPEKVVEKLSKERSGFNYIEKNVTSYTLPELLTSNNGKRVSTADLWNTIRRAEILEQFRKNMFGRVPGTRYDEMFKIINLDTLAFEGRATKKDVEIAIEYGGKSLTFHLYLFTPNNINYAVPVFLLIDPWMADKSSPHWKEKNEYWPVNDAIKRGYGMAVFDASELDPDNFDDFKNGIQGLLDQNPRPVDAWGTLAAWAWGASRCMDYLITDKNVARNKVAVVGHSRAGKTALWAGAEDTRFALVISNESGCGGAALARRRYGETVARINTSFPHWFCANYKMFNDKEEQMPFDMHMLLSLIAPRALYIACADEDLWGDPKGSYISLFNAAPVFNLLGIKSDIPESMPQLNRQIISGRVGFHIRDGVHNLLLKDWNWFMDFADIVLKYFIFVSVETPNLGVSTTMGSTHFGYLFI
jgi:hypothetical protein